MICDTYSTVFYFIVVALSFIPTTTSQNTNVTVSLNTTISNGNNEMFGDFFIVNKNSTLKVTIADFSKKNVGFIIFQAHSHLYNITLYNNTIVRGSYITGRNLGLYSPIKGPLDLYYIVNDNPINQKVYISIHGYNSIDPIPGGLNIEFPINISPFMYSKYNDHYVNIDAQAAGITMDRKKPPDYATMTYYRMYIQEFDFNEDSYFEGIRKMMSKDKILEYGTEIPQTMSRMPMRRMMSAYPGTGSVYVVICTHPKDSSRYAVYVPTTSYACSPLVEGDCSLLNDVVSEMLCASLLFVGLFTCFFGHRFFKTEMFLAGAFSGIIITYIVISLYNELMPPALAGVSVLSGLFFGGIWLLFWWFYGIPVLSVFLATLLCGFHTSAMLYYRLPTNEFIIQDDSFWALFIMCMVLTSILLLTTTYISNILCCAFLGAYAAVFPLDYYLGSNLKYIFINTVRRAVVPKFNYAVLAPPFQWRDLLVTLLWVMLTVGGFLFQHYHNRNRSPFPPPPRSISPRMPGSPLLQGRRPRYGAVNNEDILPRATIPVNIDERTPLIL